MKVLVTGGTGFVGTHVVNALLRHGHAVAVLAREPARAHNRYNKPVEIAVGNVLDPRSLARTLAGRDAVVHLVGIIAEKGNRPSTGCIARRRRPSSARRARPVSGASCT